MVRSEIPSVSVAMPPFGWGSAFVNGGLDSGVFNGSPCHACGWSEEGRCHDAEYLSLLLPSLPILPMDLCPTFPYSSNCKCLEWKSCVHYDALLNLDTVLRPNKN